jgi:lipoate-protein ligase A
VEHLAEAPSAFHARGLPDPVERAVWVCEPDRPGLVLGSAQRQAVVDAAACRRAGLEVVRRRSGGGAVLVVPGDLLWLDVLLPASDPLWERDVSRAFLGLGDVWSRALADLGVVAEVHRGGLVRSPWSELVCFAGLGAGELTVRAADGAPAKVVGLSQRRTRAGARFQCAALLRWDPAALIALLDPGSLPGPESSVRPALDGVAAGLALDGRDLLAAVLRHLPE